MALPSEWWVKSPMCNYECASPLEFYHDVEFNRRPHCDQYVPLLARAGVLPCTQFALHPSSSVANLLRVLHDYIWFNFFAGVACVW